MLISLKGADIPDIELVVQFGIPQSLSVLSQRFGCAGRSPSIHAQAILLAEKSMFKQKKKRKPGGRDKTAVNQAVMEVSEAEESEAGSGEELGDGKDWTKKVDKHLRFVCSFPRKIA
jgi:superfamily II DNA helicase RecQ